MEVQLNRYYQIRGEALRNSYYKGLIRLYHFSRLCGLLVSHDGEIAVQFKFSKSDYETIMISGKLSTSLQIECQRCLQTMQHNLESDFHFLVDATDNTVQESGLDTLYSVKGNIDLFDVIEDEIILTLPLIATHAGSTCNAYWQTNQVAAVKENPFLLLKNLKTTH